MARRPDLNFDPDFASPDQWAAIYRAYGLQVVPGTQPGKRPLLSEWRSLQNALVPDVTFARWYDPVTGEHRARRNMGIITGAASDRLLVLDLDAKPAALQWWHGICHVHNNGLEPETCRQKTGGGGQHLLFRVPLGWVAPTGTNPTGVDVRGQGGFAVMPPSRHDSGRFYEWLPGCAPWEMVIADAPAWLLEEITKLFGSAPQQTANRGQPDRIPPPNGEFDEFGSRIDGREQAMRDMVWRCVVKLRRASPIQPTGALNGQLMRDEYEVYERTVSVQNPQPAEKKATGLDRENRGLQAFAAKWQYAMLQWDEEVSAAAGEPDPSPEAGIAGAAEFAKPKLDPATGQPLPLLLSSAQFVAGFTPPEYLIDGVVQRGYLYSLTARTNHGKTAVSMYLAQCVARGEPMHGREVLAGTVLILAGENPDDIRARFLVLAEAYGFDAETVKIRFIAGVVSLIERMPQIRAEAEGIDDLVLVLVDTAAAYFPGADANSNTEQGAYARVLRSLTMLRGKPCVIVNCHPVKNASKENLLPMGGSAFVNEVDGNLTLWANNDKQSSLHWQGKFRGPEFEPFSFELRRAESERVKDAKGRLMPSVVAIEISELTMETSEMTQESAENRLLEVMHANPTASFTALAIKCGFVTDGRPQKSRVSRMIHSMVGDKLVAKHRGGKYRLTPKGQREIGAGNEE